MMGFGGGVGAWKKKKMIGKDESLEAPMLMLISIEALSKKPSVCSTFSCSNTNFELCRAVSCPLIEVRGMYVL
jgi:hypothetical protein